MLIPSDFIYISQVNSKWDLLDVVCDFYIAMDVTCSTSSILNLVAISIDRYNICIIKKNKSK